MSFQEINFVATIIQKNQVSGDIRTGIAKLVQHKKTGDIEVETEEEFFPFRQTKGFFTVCIELPQDYLHIQDFELELKTNSQLNKFKIIHDQEYQRLKSFLLFEKLDNNIENKSSIKSKNKI